MSFIELRARCFLTRLAGLQILLGYLPSDRKNWDRILARKRKEYANFCKVRFKAPFCNFKLHRGVQASLIKMIM